MAEPVAQLSELQVPLDTLIRQTTKAVVEALGLEEARFDCRRPRGPLAKRDHASATCGQLLLQPKDIPLETFFHKIVMIRNNLRVLEQKVNASDKLSDAEKFDLQQYITRCYGSLTTFNILFKNKEDQFSTK